MLVDDDEELDELETDVDEELDDVLLDDVEDEDVEELDVLLDDDDELLAAVSLIAQPIHLRNVPLAVVKLRV